MKVWFSHTIFCLVFMLLVSTGVWAQGSQTSPQTPQDFFDRANTRFDKAEYDAAIADYSEAIKLRPVAWGAFNGRGNAYYRKDDNAAALIDYNEAIRLKPDFVIALYNRSIIHLVEKRYDEALNDCRATMKLERTHSDAHVVCGMALQFNKDFDAAIAEYEKALK